MIVPMKKVSLIIMGDQKSETLKRLRKLGILHIESVEGSGKKLEELKERVNEFIRTAEGVDGVIDFDLVVRDKKNPAAFASGFDSGDHLHPSEEAYKAMAKEAFRVLRG